MQLVTVPPPSRQLVVTIDPNAIEQRKTLLDLAATITKVTNAEENELVSQCGSSIQKLIKGAQKAGLELRRPINEDADILKKAEDGFIAPLLPIRDRLSRLATVYRTEQESKVERERQSRAAEIARLQEQQRKSAEDARKAAEAGDLAGALMGDLIAQAAFVATSAAIAVPEQVAEKTAGQSFKARELGWECTDPIALWNARPDLCNAPTPKAAAIKSTCTPEHPIPGLRLWWEAKVNFKANR